MAILGSGKSTVASYLFSEMKSRGIEVELATESAKDLVWDENWQMLSNQLYVFSTQMHRIDRLIGKVEYIITDSPLLLQIGYYKERHLPAPKAFKKLCMAYNKKYDSINIYLKKNHQVSQIGRAELSLDPMKYLSTMQFDLKTDCTQKQEILEFILKNT